MQSERGGARGGASVWPSGKSELASATLGTVLLTRPKLFSPRCALSVQGRWPVEKWRAMGSRVGGGSSGGSKS